MENLTPLKYHHTRSSGAIYHSIPEKKVEIITQSVPNVLPTPVSHNTNTAVADYPDIEYARTHRIFKMKDFLSVSPEIFIRFCYISILRREPDHLGINHFTRGKDRWRKRIDAVIELLNSEEGKSRNVKLKNYYYWSFINSVVKTYKKIFIFIRNIGKNEDG